MASIFTKIIEGELPSYKIYEDDKTIAILALHQVQLGHSLVIPKKEVNAFYEMSDADYTDLMLTSQKVARAIKKVTGAARVCSMFQGFEVPHVHHHLIPANSPTEFNLALQKERPAEEMRKVCEALRKELGQD
ncbi:MAG: HIT family protein [Bdellovibrionaceae bacterium]|nr:HIT family protein [Pseudobdellovibrionaceae bacterium]